MQSEQLLRIPEVAEQLTLRPVTIRAWLVRRKLAYLRIGRSIRIPRSEVDRVLSEGMVPRREPRPRPSTVSGVGVTR